MISVTEFNEALAASLTPITLISGVGLLMICMTNRYNHATNRIRLLMAKRDTSPQRLVPVIDEEIEIIFNRVATLRRGLLCVSISALLSALLVSVSVAGRFLGVDLSAIEGIMLVTAIALIVVSALSLPSWLLYVGIAVSMPLFGAVSAFGSASVLGVPFLLALLQYNSIIVASALSLVASLGDMMPPTALAGIFAAQVVGEENYFKVLRTCLVPCILVAVWGIAVILLSGPIASVIF